MYGWDDYGGYGWMPEDFAAGASSVVPQIMHHYSMMAG